ncbi:MAG: hypothetical protein IPO43_21440 [Rhodoferax sp.]|nr:hypothetical protein [Rhodoferax sp.]
MKLLIYVAVLILGVWLWRAHRQPPSKGQPPVPGKSKSGALPHEMVACRACAMHIPAAEAVVGKLGSYCCAEHMNHSES